MMKRTPPIHVILFIITFFSLNLFSQSSRIYSDNPEELYRIALNLQSEGNLISANKYYSKVIELDKFYLNAYFNRGLNYEILNQIEKAIEDFRILASLNKNDIEVNEKLGDWYANLEILDLSLVFYSNAITLNRNTSLYVRRAKQYTKLKFFEEALSDIDEALILNPKNSEAYSIKADIFAYYNRIPEAIRYAKIALKYSPNDPYYINNLARFLAENGEFDKAILLFNKAIEISPLNDFILHKAFCYFNNNEYDNAESSASKVLFEDPYNAEAQFCIGLIKLKRNKLHAAIDFFSLAIEINNDEPEYYLRRAEAKYNGDLFYNALEDANRAKELGLSEELYDDFIASIYKNTPVYNIDRFQKENYHPETINQSKEIEDFSGL